MRWQAPAGINDGPVFRRVTPWHRGLREISTQALPPQNPLSIEAKASSRMVIVPEDRET
jgi:hypothetical protein